VPGIFNSTGRTRWLGNLARVALAGAVAIPATLAMAQAGQASAQAAQRWRLQSPQVPAGSIGSGFDAVSCGARRACMAVGNAEINGGTFLAFTEAWNGSSWVIHGIPRGNISSLEGVTCRSATSCVAVGAFSKNGTVLTLAERWNGGMWTVQPTQNPGGAARSFLVSVSCPTANACTAVGFSIRPSGADHTLAEHWNGKKWAIQGTPSPAGQMSQLTSVSCFSATACKAVGTSASGAFAEAWNGKTWKIRQTPAPRGGTGTALRGLSCISATACIATGGYFNGSHTVPLAERWNGHTWQPQHAAVPGGATASGLSGVSCVKATSCSAVGFLRNGGGVNVTLAEHWNGRKWAVQSTPALAGAQSAALSSVSCPVALVCTATGFFTDASQTEIVLAERYS
jgi:hypothetical protein